MANRRNRKRPSERGKADEKLPREASNPIDEEHPFHMEFDRMRDTLYPNLRMKLVSIPCPSCTVLIDDLAENHTREQKVRLAYHKTLSGDSCEASGSLFTLPVSGGNEGMAYMPTGIPPKLDPSDIKHYTPAPPSYRSTSEGILDYALSCPIANLIKLHAEVDKMAVHAFDISAIFRQDGAFEDSMSSHIESIKSQIVKALQLRFTEGIARAFHVEGEQLSFQDPSTREYVDIPFDSIRVVQFRATTIRPANMDEAEEESDEDV